MIAMLQRVVGLGVLLSVLAGGPAWVNDASAAGPAIEETGITAFDDVFMKVKSLQATLNRAESRLNTARDKVAVAVGQPAGTSIRMSMWELKQRAGGTVKVTMNGPNPVVSLSGGHPEAAEGVRAVNDAVREVGRVVTDLSKLPPQVVALVNACKAFPSQVGAAAREAGLAPMEIPKLVKTVGGNVKATAALPKAIGSLVKTAKDMITGIPEGLAATAPPIDEAMAAKKAAKKAAKSAKKTGTSEKTPPSAVMEKVTAAMTLFADAEVSQALRVLNAAEALALRNPDAISPDDYQALYQSRGLVLLVQGDTPGALKDISKALEADPSAKPIASLGDEYAKLHKGLQKSGAFR